MTKHGILLSSLLLLLAVPGISATKTKTKAKAKAQAVDYVATARTAIQNYEFERADSLLKIEIKNRKSKKQKTTDVDMLRESFQAQRLLIQATERVIVFDSLVCSKDSMLTYIPISRDAGRLDTWARTYYTTDSLGCTLYENELATKRYFAKPTNKGHILLVSSDKIGNEWSTPTYLEGLNDDDNQNYPYLLSDGITLYYGAQGSESIGGYDIFVTRNNGDDGACLSPENIGFPFNSTANDYLFAIDEMNQIGWFVTDRRQPKGYVCIYAFIPNETRRVYGSEVSSAKLGALAQLTSIRATWYDKDAVAAAQNRLQLLREGKSATHLTISEFCFPINATTNYTSLTHFRSAKAKELFADWIELNKTVKTDRQLLNQLRDRYAQSDEQARQQQQVSLTNIENNYYNELRELKRLAKEIRQLENAEL